MCGGALNGIIIAERCSASVRVSARVRIGAWRFVTALAALLATIRRTVCNTNVGNVIYIMRDDRSKSD